MNVYLRNVIISLSILLFCTVLVSNSILATTTTSTQLGYTDPATNNGNEFPLCLRVSNIIGNYSLLAGRTTYNKYGSSSTKPAILDAAEGMGVDSYSDVFFVGHGGYDWTLFGNQYFIISSDGYYVYDYNAIYDWANSAPSPHLVFLWARQTPNDPSKAVYQSARC